MEGILQLQYLKPRYIHHGHDELVSYSFISSRHVSTVLYPVVVFLMSIASSSVENVTEIRRPPDVIQQVSIEPDNTSMIGF